MDEMDDQERINFRMASGQPFTYSDLCGLTADGQDQERLADRTIQKWRRRGWIAFSRQGRSVIWCLTDSGRSALAMPTSRTSPSDRCAT